jgi:hypothetical protein
MPPSAPSYLAKRSIEPLNTSNFRIIDLPIETAARLWPAFLREARGNRLRVDVRRKPASGFLVVQRLLCRPLERCPLALRQRNLYVHAGSLGALRMIDAI